MKIKSPWLIRPHTKVRLNHCETRADGGSTAENATAVLTGYRDKLASLQEVLYASQTNSVLIVLQGMDTAGKDGAISHIFSGINPQGCDVAAFKVPTSLEAHHDFLWRIHAQVPPRGMIGIFNRSHYEDVLPTVVHKLITKKVARQRIDEINAFEQTLADNGTLILKFFLHISRDEQRSRLESRLADPKKHWKFQAGDLKERQFWPQYQTAYEDILTHTSKKHAPWFVIPADHKWYRNLAISDVLVQALTALKLTYPQPTVNPTTIKL